MLKAVIFDMNGVVINDERIHQEAWQKYCQNHGFHITEEEFKHNVFGRTEKDTFAYLYKHTITPKELERYSDERVDVAIEIFKSQVKKTTGLDTLLDELNKNKVPMAVATSSRKRYCNFIMDALHIRKYFKVVLTAHDITKGKPDPEIYIKTAKALHVKPSECIVFEDAMSGIKSAKAAGMKVIAIATTHSMEELNIADKVIGSFNEVNLQILNKLF